MPKSLASPIRLENSLVDMAKREGSIYKRSAPRQIEYWAELGRAAERTMDLKDVYAVIQGFKQISLETVNTAASVEPSTILMDLNHAQKRGKLSNMVSKSAIYYEANAKTPGLLDMVDTSTGKRQPGHFRNGVFKAVK